MKNFLFVLLLFLPSALKAGDRALWVTAWELTNRTDIEKVVTKAYVYNYHEIFAEIRYRGDTLYRPNLHDSTYKNPEKLSYFLSEKDDDFDPLQYLLDLAHFFDIEVHAWATVFVVTPRSVKKLPLSHVFFQHPEWITCSTNFLPMSCHSYEGAYLDPAIIDAQNYIAQVLLDLVRNYKIDGVVLDYVRYPARKFGYNPLALSRYITDIYHGAGKLMNFSQWRQQELSLFVQRIGILLKRENPDLRYALTAWPDYNYAKNELMQDWQTWLSFPEVDLLYFMVYTKWKETFEKHIAQIITTVPRKKIGIALRAWDESGTYSVDKIARNIRDCMDLSIHNISLFHCGGMVENYYFEKLNQRRVWYAY